MSGLERSIREVCADQMLDMVTLVRSPGGGWQASVKRAYRGWSVHHAADPVEALHAALTAPHLAPVASKPASPPATAPAVDDDLFG